jgi:hypothetical protein
MLTFTNAYMMVLAIVTVTLTFAHIFSELRPRPGCAKPRDRH